MKLRYLLSRNYLLSPVDSASLAVVRILIGLMVAYDAIKKGAATFAPNGLNPQFVMKFPYFEWVPQAPQYASVFAGIMLISGLGVAFGFLTRLSTATALLVITFGFLGSAELYLNHYYLLIIVLFLLFVAPANRSFSVDRLIWGKSLSPMMSNIFLLIVKAQVEIVLVYAGLVKLNSDWFIHHEPLRTWLIKRRDDEGVIINFLWPNDLLIALGNYGVMALHLIGAPLLLYKPTRLPIFCIYVIFHITNHFTFNIGIFPWMTIALTTLFFRPDWPRLAIEEVRRTFGWTTREVVSNYTKDFLLKPGEFRTKIIFIFAAVWLMFQILLPLRHYLYPGDVGWTYEGHRFAWRMKLVDREVTKALFVVHDREGQKLYMPNLNNALTQRQVDSLTRPDLARQIALQLAEKYRNWLGAKNIRVHAAIEVSGNNRVPMYLINPSADLVASTQYFLDTNWLFWPNPYPTRPIEEVRANPAPAQMDILTVLRDMNFRGVKRQDCSLSSIPNAPFPHLAICHFEQS